MATPAQHTDRERYGPGKLWIAPLGTITNAFTPTVAASAFTQGTTSTAVPGAAAWLPLGRTNDGMEFTWDISTDDDSSAESYDPHRTLMTGRSASMKASLRQVNITNLKAAFNLMGTTIADTTATSFARISPPNPGSETRAQILWESDDNSLVIVMYQVLQVNGVSLAGKKGAESMRLEVEFHAELPASSAIATTPADILVAGVSYANTVSAD